jgi:predicted enzyme related to lactoylglutathione lyase
MSDTPPCTPPQTGEFSWNELITANPAAAGDFYRELFGWQSVPLDRPDAPPYVIFKNDTKPMGVGGMMAAPQPGIPSHWMPYVVVADADASLAKAVELGAKVCLPVLPIPGVGRIACLMDPQGAVIGLHELPKPGV